jgi:hypothetical protein
MCTFFSDRSLPLVLPATNHNSSSATARQKTRLVVSKGNWFLKLNLCKQHCKPTHLSDSMGKKDIGDPPQIIPLTSALLYLMREITTYVPDVPKIILSYRIYALLLPHEGQITPSYHIRGLLLPHEPQIILPH